MVDIFARDVCMNVMNIRLQKSIQKQRLFGQGQNKTPTDLTTEGFRRGLYDTSGFLVQ